MHCPSPATHTVIRPSGEGIDRLFETQLAERHAAEESIDLERSFPHHPHRDDDADDDQNAECEKDLQNCFCPSDSSSRLAISNSESGTRNRNAAPSPGTRDACPTGHSLSVSWGRRLGCRVGDGYWFASLLTLHPFTSSFTASGTQHLPGYTLPRSRPVTSRSPEAIFPCSRASSNAIGTHADPV